EVAEINGDVARVQRGSVSFRVPLAQLRVVPAPTPSPGPPFVSRGTGPRSARVVAADDAPPTELHLVGLRTAEALDRLERFLDHAQTAGVASVRIVHGIGSGALKRAVTEYLARSSYCTRFTEAASASRRAHVMGTQRRHTKVCGEARRRYPSAGDTQVPFSWRHPGTLQLATPPTRTIGPVGLVEPAAGSMEIANAVTSLARAT